MGDGTNHEPPIDSGGGDSSEGNDDTRPTRLDEHTSEEETKEAEESSNSGSGSGAVPAGAAAAGAAAGGAAGGRSGAGAATGAGSTTPTPEEPSGEDPDDDDASENSEDSEDSEPQPEQEKEQPDEEPDWGEDSDDTKEDEENEDQEDDEEDEDDREDEQFAQMVVHSDPWDSVGWGIYPVRLQLKEEYGDQVKFDDRLVPVREFDSREEMKQHWVKWASRHSMPVNTGIWTNDAPESTELSNRAFAAAREQSIPRAKRFMRRLKVAAIVEGYNIEDRETLLELAQNVGLDIDRLEEDWDEVRVRPNVKDVETPKITIHVDGETITQPGLVTINDVKTPLKRAGLEADDPQSLYGFVDEYGPVALKEVCQVYGYEEGEAHTELHTTENIEAVKYGDTTFWDTV